MAAATYEVPNFLGGEISQFAQGRTDRPDYRVSLNVCLNSFPVEIGAWARRPGSAYAGHTRGGSPGREIKFDFEQATPATLEFTDGFLRFRAGTVLIGTNDDQAVVAISTANPAVMQVQNAVDWGAGNTLIFLGAATPLLENRQLRIGAVNTTTLFTLQDALTGANIDGSTLGPLAAGATVRRMQELSTVYLNGAWSNIRAVQAETTDILLCPGVAPQALTVATLPSAGISPVFAVEPAVFNDGPYLDPFTNGAQVVPSGTQGVITLEVEFSQFNSAAAYARGSFVTSSSLNYISLIDQNVGNTPVSSPTDWAATSASAAINNGQGFLGSDIGRLVRLFSEPALWSVAASYTAGNTVSYNPSGQPGAATYYQSLTSNSGVPPGTDLASWQLLPQGAAIWTWGRITGLSNLIDRGTGNPIGNMTLFNGPSGAFDGNFSKSASSSAGTEQTGGTIPLGSEISVVGFVGKNFGGSPQAIAQATVYPSTDLGMGRGSATVSGTPVTLGLSFQLVLRASTSAPGNPSDGTALASTSFTIGSSTPVTLVSNDQVTSWNYVWVEIIITTNVPTSGFTSSWSLIAIIAQISFFSPTTSATSSAGCTVEILGPPLLYETSILTWRMGVYSNTTGYPTCGCWDDGRLWLGGAVANRFDASTSNGLLPGSGTIDFSPTDQYGNVADDNAISETINADSVNPLYWMVPDLQGILIGTQAGEFLLLAPTSGSISPSNITSRRSTRIGSSNIEPRRTDHTLMFVKRYGRKLMEYFADVFSGKFSAPNIAERAEHIPRTGMAEIAYTEAVTPILWGRNNDGSLFGVTYKRDALTTSQGPTYAAWHRHALGSGRTVESITAGPSVDGNLDSLTMVTNDPATNIRHVEVMTDTPDELTELADCWFLDDAVNPTSISSNLTQTDSAPYGGLTINGLWHLNGKTVQVFAGGADCGDPGEGKAFVDFVVTNGSVFVPYGDSISAGSGRGQFTAALVATLSLSQIVVGFTYNSDGQIVRRNEPAETGARNGPALGKLRRNHRLSMLLSNSLGISIGTTFDKMFPARFKQIDGITDIAPLTTFSGVYQDSLRDDYSYDGMVCWRVSRPFPANIAALAGNIQAQDQ